MATIIIPAHNEATVIGRTLEELATGELRPGTRVLVAANGCTDDTIAIAESFADRLDVTVLDLPVASKQAALNGAEDVLFADDRPENFPRVYLDADIAAPAASVNRVLEVLESGEVLAARPPLAYQTQTADALVKAFYRARSRTPEVLQALWGAGFYAVSVQGRARWGRFPLDAPDDLYVDSLFSAEEKTVVGAEPVRVQVPRSSLALLKTLKRVYRPSEAVQELSPQSLGSSGNTLVSLLKANSGRPSEALDALSYIGFAVTARVALKLDGRGGDHSGASWERDDSTR
ncbi:glycosyltransferase [Luteococcus peritonei]|uniref:Glycosyltransferase n=1 Tax=Luteococcus peritonei TaxID=88874 RepID=A0ABW4RSU5_9ACTN